MTDKHTPGPWHRHQPDELEHSTLVCAGEHSKCVARVFDNFGTREANAQLIAAAPDLLAALHTIAAVVDKPVSPREYKILHAARAAIANATK